MTKTTNLHPKTNKLRLITKNLTSFIILALFSLMVIVPVHADTNTEKLNQLEAETAAATATLNQLKSQKDSLANEIAIFDAQITVLQAQITQANGQISDLNVKIINAELDLKKQKELMGEYLKTMYIEGQVSTIELIAKSKNFSDFIDQSEYTSAIQQNVQETANKINELRKNLESQKLKSEQLKAEAESKNAQITAQRTAKSQLLQSTQGDENKYQQIVNNNNAQIGILKCIISGGCNGDANGNLIAINIPLYYNQTSFGSTEYSPGYRLSDYGCLITSLAMAHGISPLTEMTRYSYNSNGEMMGIGGSWGNWSSLVGRINSSLDSGRPVIVGLNMAGGYTHFVLIKNRSGDKYYINDPYFAAGQAYNTSRVYEAIFP